MKRILALVLALLFVACTLAACDEEGVVTHTHAFGEWEDLVAPTCISKGVSARSCTCGHTETKLIDEVAHQPNEEGYGCAVCSHLHELDSTEVIVEPTCAEKGKKAYRCACGFTEYGDIKKIDTHNFDSETGLCLVCGAPDIPAGVLQDSNGVRWVRDDWGKWREYDNIGSNVQYGGETINVLCWDSSVPEFEQSEDSADYYLSAIYYRNRAVQERLDVNLNFITVTAENYTASVRNAYNAGTHDFDILAAPASVSAELVKYGYVQDLFDIEKSYIELEKPWWPKGLARDLAINESLYFVTGDISGQAMMSANCVYFNVDLVNAKYEQEAYEYFAENPLSTVTRIDNTPQDIYLPRGSANAGYSGELEKESVFLTAGRTARDWLYELVNTGKWTVDELISLSSDCYNDKTGNGLTVDDTYGLTSVYYNMGTLYGSAGLRMIDRDAQGGLQVSDDLTSSDALSLFSKIGNLMRSRNYYTYSGTEVDNFWHRPFRNGNALFAVSDFRFASDYLLVTDRIREYGVLPMPKYSESQTEYYTMLDSGDITVYSVYADCADRDSEQETLTMLSAVLECMASEAYRRTTVVTWELNMQLKSFSDIAPEVMCEMIHDSMRLDLGHVMKGELCGGIESIDMMFATEALNGSDWSTVSGDYLNALSQNLNAFVGQLNP